MHASVIEAKTYRDRENDRRRHNSKKKQANGLIKAFGLNPAFTPAPTGENRWTRQDLSRNTRKHRRFFINLSLLTLPRKK